MPESRKIKKYSVQIDGWSAPLVYRAFGENDAIELVRIHQKFGPERKITAREITDDTLPSRHPGGRPRLTIDPKLVCDTLRDSKDINYTARKYGVSRAYLYARFGAQKIRELVSAEVTD